MDPKKLHTSPLVNSQLYIFFFRQIPGVPRGSVWISRYPRAHVRERSQGSIFCPFILDQQFFRQRFDLLFCPAVLLLFCPHSFFSVCCQGHCGAQPNAHDGASESLCARCDTGEERNYGENVLVITAERTLTARGSRYRSNQVAVPPSSQRVISEQITIRRI